jgi:hypothetical protein
MNGIHNNFKNVLLRNGWLLLGFILLPMAGCYSKQDESYALKATERVHSQLQSGDFATVYQEAGSGFKKATDQSSFETAMTRLYKENGALRRITPKAYQSAVDVKAGRTYTVISELEFERLRAQERLVFVRAQSGQLQLWDLVMDRLP